MVTRAKDNDQHPKRTALGARMATTRITLQDIADRADVSKSLVAKVAQGTRKPNEAIKAAVEELFDLPWREVLGSGRTTRKRPRAS